MSLHEYSFNIAASPSSSWQSEFAQPEIPPASDSSLVSSTEFDSMDQVPPDHFADVDAVVSPLPPSPDVDTIPSEAGVAPLTPVVETIPEEPVHPILSTIDESDESDGLSSLAPPSEERFDHRQTLSPWAPSSSNSDFGVAKLPSPESTDAGRLLGRVIQKPAHLLRVQARRAPGGSGRSECARDAVRALVALIHSDATAHHHGDARPDVVTQRHCA